MAGGMPGMPGAEEAQAGAAAAGMPDFASAMAGMNPRKFSFSIFFKGSGLAANPNGLR